MFDWLDWIFDTVADVFVDDDTLTAAAQAFEGGSAGGELVQPLDLPAVEISAPEAPLDAAADPALAAQTQQPAPAPAPNPAPVVAPAAEPTTGAFDANSKTPSLYGKEGDAPAPFAATWFSKLTPGAQAALAQGVVGGASGLLQSLAQKNMLEDQEKREERAREDRIRRTSVAAFGDGAFKPKGIIDSKRSAA